MQILLRKILWVVLHIFPEIHTQVRSVFPPLFDSNTFHVSVLLPLNLESLCLPCCNGLTLTWDMFIATIWKHWVKNCFCMPLQVMLPKIVVMYVITIAGGTFYLSKFPEKYFPGMTFQHLLCMQ